MDYISSIKIEDIPGLAKLSSLPAGQNVKTNGIVHRVRDMGDFAFIILRKRDGLLQCVMENSAGGYPAEGSAVVAEGTLRQEPRAPGGFEMAVTSLKVLSAPFETLPSGINKQKLGMSIEAKLNLRPVALRNVHERAIFRLQAALARGFRDYLQTNGFTEIHTPKIVSAGAEGGANIFRLDYFGRKAYLAQSPQFYKQMMVGVFERVYEIGPVFRAEKHNTTRHLNEYTGLDFEMGFISGFEDIMAMEAGYLRHTMNLLREEYAYEISLLDVEVPDADNIPVVRFSEAKEMAAAKYGKKIKNPYDLEPEEEHLISRMMKEDYNADFVFVTHYPSKKRPFYAMDDPEDKRFTLSFDLLFRGMEITTGGQRIHDYQEQIEKMQKRGMNPDDFESYLMIHKYGMPPHGGLGLGLERFCMKLAGVANVREAALFPRDKLRLEP